MEINVRTALFALVLAGGAGFWIEGGASAEEDAKHKNLKVLEDNGKSLEAGMKNFSKGLGVKCGSCHVKGKFDADDVTAKSDARKFFQTVLTEKDQAKRDAALTALLTALKLKEAKSAPDVWKGVEMWKMKK